MEYAELGKISKFQYAIAAFYVLGRRQLRWPSRLWLLHISQKYIVSVASGKSNAVCYSGLREIRTHF